MSMIVGGEIFRVNGSFKSNGLAAVCHHEFIIIMQSEFLLEFKNI